MESKAENRRAPGGPPAADSGDFVKRLLGHQRQIHACIGSLVPDANDLDDIYQQTCLLPWEHREEFDPDRPFFPWACGFARNKVFDHLRRRGRAAISLSTDVLAQIATAREAAEPLAEARRKALDACLAKLTEHQRSLLRARYASGESLGCLADTLATSAAALTMRLQRIRHALLRCIEQTISTAEGR